VAEEPYLRRLQSPSGPSQPSGQLAGWRSSPGGLRWQRRQPSPHAFGAGGSWAVPSGLRVGDWQSPQAAGEDRTRSSSWSGADEGLGLRFWSLGQASTSPAKEGTALCGAASAAEGRLVLGGTAKVSGRMRSR
jgi:hypothetical protein